MPWLVAASPVHSAAQGLMVLPVSIEMGPRQEATTVSVTNRGATPTSFQIRVYKWIQSEGKDQLSATDDVAVSPPIATLASMQTQIVRVVLRERSHNHEDTYRIILDQLPAPTEAGRVQLVLRLSMPIFVEPIEPAVAHLQYRVEHAAGEYVLIAGNDGGRHEKVRDARLILPDGSQVNAITDGSPYVLAGAVRRWTISPVMMPLRSGGKASLHLQEDHGSVTKEVSIEELP